MKLTRRDVGALLPAVLAGGAAAQEGQTRRLASKVYHHGQIPYEGDQRKKGRRFFYGATRSGFNLETHETILGGGVQTHAPHQHGHEEIVIVVEGQVEVYLDGKTEIAETGSVIYFGPSQMQSARNAGPGPCRYYVIELRGDEG